jgi:poly(hydroxyalkanoate) depolymerase family esterase
MVVKSFIVAVFVAGFFLALAQTASAGEWVSGKAETPFGAREYKLWVPSSVTNRKSAPLVMMLHGCMQTPDDLATISGMNNVADQNGFLVVYPAQTQDANPLRCWNWFDPKHQARGAGEPAILAAVVQQIQGQRKIDDRRIYVAGISAGGAMAVVMGVTYPDLFRGVGSCAGLAYRAAITAESGLAAMKSGGPDPAFSVHENAQAMAASYGRGAQRRVPVIIFQGDADPYVKPVNADQLVTQWAGINDWLDDSAGNQSVRGVPVRTEPGQVPDGHAYTRAIYHDRRGRILLEKWTVSGLGHAWSGSPEAKPFADPKGPNASRQMWRFFADTTAEKAR